MKIVFSSLLESPEEGQLDKFFDALVQATAQVNNLTSSFGLSPIVTYGWFSDDSLYLQLSFVTCTSPCDVLNYEPFRFQENVTIISNPAVRDTILNLTLTALAPQFPGFEPSDFALWFQVNLVVVLASFTPESLVVIPRNISCDSYRAM